MAFTLKFKNTETKCNTCEYSQRMQTLNEQYVYCHSLEQYVPPIYDCTKYSEKGVMELWEMEKKGWVLEVKKGRVIGFTNPEERKNKIE